MDLLVAKADDTWVMHIGRHRYDSDPVRLVSASKSLFRLITAIKNVYPEARVWVDPNVTENPFTGNRIATSRYFGMTPDYAEIQYAIDNPRTKECSLCRGVAYYNPDYRIWQCSKCKAHESYLDKGRFFKLSRNANKTRMH